MPQEIVIVDYGSGNLRSIENALRRSARRDQCVVLSGDPASIASAERIVLPGVGSFPECRRKLDESGLLPALSAVVEAGRPFFGVCVGMQILASMGEEFGQTPGLGWIPGVTRRLRGLAADGAPLKLPHISWSPVESRDDELFTGIPAASHFYFVHSYVLECSRPQDAVASATYGERFTAAVRRGNVFGSQFHPEKSDRAGLRLLENFCRWNP